MTPAQADRRIIVSRQRLHARDGEALSEVAALQEIAERHPGKAMKIGRLIEAWVLIAGRNSRT